MPKLPRVPVRQFGTSGASTDFGQFSSKTVSAPQTSKDPSIIMQLAGWLTGWTAAAVGARFNPFLEDMNGVCLVIFYFFANLFERGIPDWDSATTYFKGAVVQDPAGSGQMFYSLTDNNLNQALPLSASNAQWQWINPPAYLKGAAATVGTLPKVSGTSTSGAPGSKDLTDSQVSEDGSNVIIGLPLKFPNGTTQAAAAQPITQQNAVTGSRAFNTTYQNTTGRPLMATVSVSMGVSIHAEALTDGSLTPTTQVARVGDFAGSSVGTMTFWVLPGNYYRINSVGANLDTWTEWN